MLPSDVQDRPAARSKLVAGRLCLDFANTVGGWNGGVVPFSPRDDRLIDYADFLAWAWRVGTLDEAAVQRLWRLRAQRPAEALSVAARARRLRDGVHAIAWNLEQRRPQRPADLDALATEVRVAREKQQLEPGAGRLEWRLASDAKALDAPLWPVALSAESYFTTADLSRLHSCPGEECGWLFEDTSRNRSRHWCDMADCGNLAKLRRFRARPNRRRK